MSTPLHSALPWFVIARKVYQGYGYNTYPLMLYPATGMVLFTAVPAVFLFFLSLFTGLLSYFVAVVTNGSELLGLVAIAYSLCGRFGLDDASE